MVHVRFSRNNKILHLQIDKTTEIKQFATDFSFTCYCVFSNRSGSCASIYTHACILLYCMCVCKSVNMPFRMNCRTVQRWRHLIYHTGWGSKPKTNTCLVQKNIHSNYDTLVEGRILCSISFPVFNLSFMLVWHVALDLWTKALGNLKKCLFTSYVWGMWITFK